MEKQNLNKNLNKNLIENEIKERAYVIAYDLPSENHVSIKDENVKMEIRNVRVNATYKLYKLGVNATNSVILVPLSNSDKIDKTIEEVNELYEKLNESIKTRGYGSIGKPLIKKIKILEYQYVDFKELAEKQLMEKLDEQISKLANVISELNEIVEEEKRKKMKYNVNRLSKEIKELEKIASDLELKTNGKFELISEMLKQIYELLGGE